MGDAPETLDPEDWEEHRAVAHRMVDDAVDYIRDIRSRPLWQDMPQELRARFQEGVPENGQPINEVYRQIVADVLPYPMGNIHPRFWMWYMGASNFTGALGDFLAAILGSNLGGGDHAAAEIDKQVVGWMKEMLGYPATASGTLVSGGSMANLIGLTVARNTMSGIDLRELGAGALTMPMRFYGSDQIHSCHQIAVEAMGLGNRALRRVPSDAACRMDLPALRRAIADDREAGLTPACVIATAGTVNTGAIDDLDAIADLCAAEGLWMHVDGCIGALLSIAPGEERWCKGSRGRIPSLSIRTNGSTRRSRSVAPWFGMPKRISVLLLSPRNIWNARRAASPQGCGCTISVCKPREVFAL